MSFFDAGAPRNLIAACAAITVFGFAFGMTYPLLSLILESRGTSPQMIGLNSAMMPIGILLFSSIIPALTGKFGAKTVAICAAIFTSVLIIGYRVFPSLEAWFLLRLCQGMTISTLFVLSEAWIVGCTNPENRGRIVAIYASVLSASFAAGPFIVSLTGIEGWFPFLVGSLVLLVGAIPLFFIVEKEGDSPEETVTSGVLSFIPKAPLLLASVAAFAIFDAATLSLIPVYAIKYNLSVTQATYTLVALIVGNVVLQYPIGMLADRYPRRLVLCACAIVATAMMAILPTVMGTALMWPVLVLAGTTGYGIYTVSLTALGDRFSGKELIDGTSAFASMWGLGALIGSLLGGWSMGLFGRDGLPLSMAFVFGLLVIGLIARGNLSGK